MHLQPTFEPRSSIVICKVMLAATFTLSICLTALLAVSFLVYHNEYVLGRILISGTALGYLLVAGLLLRRGQWQATAYMLIAFFMVIATSIAWWWGINTPIAMLIYSLAIVMSGILLTARHAILASFLPMIILFAMQTMMRSDMYQPNEQWTAQTSSYGDVAAYCLIFSMMSLVAWLYKQEMDGSLAKARQAEIALQLQKDTLAQRVKERTAELRQAQLEERRQLYRFAQFGQMGASLLHDLANYLSVLHLEIEGLGLQSTKSKNVERIHEVMRYLQKLIDNTRLRLRGESTEKEFNLIRLIEVSIKFITFKATKEHIAISWHAPVKNLPYYGDPTCLSQVIIVIISNAIEAYQDQTTTSKRKIEIHLDQENDHLVIRIGNWGKKITPRQRQMLFKPFESSKKSGMGLGLLIARQTIEGNFQGSLRLNTKSDHTEFVIQIPLKVASK